MMPAPGKRLSAAFSRRFPLLSLMLRDGYILILTPSSEASASPVLIDTGPGDAVALRTLIQFDGDVTITCRKGPPDPMAQGAHKRQTQTLIDSLRQEIRRVQLPGKIIDGARIAFLLGAPPAASLMGAFPAYEAANAGAEAMLGPAGNAWAAVQPFAGPVFLYVLPECVVAALRPVIVWLVRRKLRHYGISV